MGGEPPILPTAGSPLVHALALLVAWAVLWAVAEALGRLVGADPTPHKVVSVLAWGCGYIAATAYLARTTTARIMATVERDLIPHASPAYLDAVAADLERRHTPARTIVIPVLTAAGASAAAVLAIALGEEEIRNITILDSPVLLFGPAVLFLRFIVSGRSVAAARFYLSFADHLEGEQGRALYVLGAAESPMIKGLARLGGQVLLFWAFTFLAILSALVLALPWPGQYRFAASAPFLVVFVPIASFFTLGMGSLAYLSSEAKIGAALRRFTEDQAAILQRRSNALLDPLANRVPADGRVVAELTEWHDRILAGGRYGSRAGTAVSIALPFLLPAVTLVKWVIEQIVQGPAAS